MRYSSTPWEEGIASLDIDEDDQRWSLKEQFFDYFVRNFDCGPSDGGCLAMAQSIQLVLGGQIWVIEGAINSLEKQAQHAIVRLDDGRFIDAYGCGSMHSIIENFRSLTPWTIQSKLSLRPYANGDLPEACRHKNPSQVAALATIWHSLDQAQRSIDKVRSPDLRLQRERSAI